jgi:tetratricopeptide (TPR) repeat protein
VPLAPLVLAAALAAAPTPPAGPSGPEGTAASPAPAAAAPAAPAAPPGLDEALAAVDAAWPRRDEPGGLDAEQAALDAARALAPGAYGVLWRQARLEVWRSEDPALKDEQKSVLGKRAWGLAEQAIAADPQGVEGYFYAVSGMGNYSLGIGILSALAQGIEGKFKDRLSRAEQLDPGFQGGAIPTAWGRFWFKLPWPKHDAKKSQKALEAALAANPDNVRVQVYLGDLHDDEGRRDAALAAYQAALRKPPGQYDAPEERRWQAVARAALEKRTGR